MNTDLQILSSGPGFPTKDDYFPVSFYPKGLKAEIGKGCPPISDPSPRAAPLIMSLFFRLSLRLGASVYPVGSENRTGARATYFPAFALPARSAFNKVLCLRTSLRLCAFARHLFPSFCPSSAQRL